MCGSMVEGMDTPAERASTTAASSSASISASISGEHPDRSLIPLARASREPPPAPCPRLGDSARHQRCSVRRVVGCAPRLKLRALPIGDSTNGHGEPPARTAVGKFPSIAQLSIHRQLPARGAVPVPSPRSVSSPTSRCFRTGRRSPGGSGQWRIRAPRVMRLDSLHRPRNRRVTHPDHQPVSSRARDRWRSGGRTGDRKSSPIKRCDGALRYAVQPDRRWCLSPGRAFLQRGQMAGHPTPMPTHGRDTLPPFDPPGRNTATGTNRDRFLTEAEMHGSCNLTRCAQVSRSLLESTDPPHAAVRLCRGERSVGQIRSWTSTVTNPSSRGSSAMRVQKPPFAHHPPSITTVVPVRSANLGSANAMIAAANSGGSAVRRWGVRSSTACSRIWPVSTP